MRENAMIAKDVGFSFPERGREVTMNRRRKHDLLPMNPEGVEVDVSQGGHMY